MTTSAPAELCVLGAGSWGTALAVQFARAGHPTRLWGHIAAEQRAMAAARCNTLFLPGVIFPQTLTIHEDLATAVDDVDTLLLAVPSHALREVLTRLQPLLSSQAKIAWATKGFELDTGLLPHQVARQVLGTDREMAVLSGPTFAKEVGAGLPTAMTVASSNNEFATDLALRISSDNFRAYTSTDIIGVEVGGATKNVLAVGAGLADGLDFGANTRVALITRGLAEMTRLGVALGAQRETFMGLAGLGDLVLTCTDDQSRNRRFGKYLAKGLSVDQALKEIGQVVEGYMAAKAVHGVARARGVEMPICDGIYQMLHQNLPPNDVVRALMSRPIKAEFD